MPKPEITRRAAIIPAMVKVLEFELEDGVDVVSAVGWGVGFASSITKIAVVRPGTLKELLSNEACFTTSSAEFC